MDRDPRLARARKAERDAKERAKKEKYEAKQAALAKREAEEAAERKQILDAMEKEKEDSAAAKKAREAEKKQAQKERKRLRGLCGEAAEASAETANSVEFLCSAFDLIQLKELCGKIDGADASSVVSTIAEAAGALEKVQEAERQKLAQEQEAIRRVEQEAALEEERRNAVPWSDEEKGLLCKAVKKFPPGCPARWKKCTDFVGGNHSEKAVIAMARDLGTKVGGEHSYAQDGAAFEKAMQQRQGSLTNKAAEASEAEAARKAAAQGKRLPSTESIPKKEEKKQEKIAAPVISEWTPEQQKLLEVGLKTYPASDKERWVKIAGDVPGKSKKECVARYKEIVAALKAKKAAAPQ